MKIVMQKFVGLAFGVLFCVGAVHGCLGSADEPSPEVEDRAVRLASLDFDQRVVVPSSVLEFRLRSTDRLVADSATVTLTGSHSTQGRFAETFDAEVDRLGDVGDLVVRLPADAGLWSEAGAASEVVFDGSIEVELSDGLGPAIQGRIEDAHLEFVPQLRPRADSFQVGNVYPNERVEIEGGGFLRPVEGTTWAKIESGHVEYADASRRDITGEQIAIEWAGQRDRASFPIQPAVFGVQVASFSATIRLENEPNGADPTAADETHEIDGSVEQAHLARLSPEAGSRGQKITFVGRGLVDTDEDAGYGMVFRYEGTFTPDDPELPSQEFGPSNPLLRAPDRVVGEQEAEQSVWYTIEDDRTLSGLGAAPGVFEGTITPELFAPFGEQEGLSWEGQFRVLPTRQVVYLKYLAAFSQGLEKYGVRNVERDIRDRVREVVNRDYDGINVDLREDPPEDFIHYAVIELGGPDPTGRNAFGYDNTFNGVAKDTGNLYLADYIGGVNADSDAQFNNPYGGVFIESFSYFSPTLTPGNEDASEEFDRILGPFMPALGGEPIKGTEWPDGPRSDAIAEAIHMVGSVVGDTVSHELGHSMGLSYVPEDDIEPTNHFHNTETGSYIMDPGSERPFAERAELDGHEPARFNEQNYDYLRRHLPAPE